MEVPDRDIEGFSLKSSQYKNNCYIKIIKYDKELFEIVIRSIKFCRDYDKIYELEMLFEFSRTKLGFKNLFRKCENKIKANKVDNLIEVYSTLKNILIGDSYDKEYLSYILEQIMQTYGEIKRLNLKEIHEYKKLFYSPTKILRTFENVEEIANYLENEDALF